VYRGSQQVTHIKHLGAGVYREWLADGRVCVMLSTQVGHEVTDVWAAAIKKLLDDAEPGKPVYLIYDFSASRTILTPYNQQKVMEVAAYRPEIANVIAVIIQKNLFGQIMKAFLDRLRFPHITVQVFFSRGEGEAWIMEKLAEEPKNPNAAKPLPNSDKP